MHARPGFSAAVAKSLLHGPIFNYTIPYEKLARTDMDVLVIWVRHCVSAQLPYLRDQLMRSFLKGTEDESVPYDLSGIVMRTLGSQATLHTIQGGGHDLPTSDHKDVLPALLKFFR